MNGGTVAHGWVIRVRSALFFFDRAIVMWRPRKPLRQTPKITGPATPKPDDRTPGRRHRRRPLSVETLNKRELMAADFGEGVSDRLRFYLVDVDTDRAIAEVRRDSVVDAARVEGRRISLFAEKTSSRDAEAIQSVRTQWMGLPSRLDNRGPYAAAKEYNGNFVSGVQSPSGVVDVRAEAFDRRSGKGEVLETIEFQFTIAPLSSSEYSIDVTDLPSEILDVDPELSSAVVDDDQDDFLAIQAALDAAAEAVRDGAESATVYLPAGTFLTSGSLQVDAGVNIVGAGIGQTVLTNDPSLSFERGDITDRDVDPASVNRDGYLIDFGVDADNASLRGLTLRGPEMIGGVFAFRSDGLTIESTRFENFLWTGLRTFTTSGTEFTWNEFHDAGGTRLKADGSPGPRSGAIFSTFHRDAEVSHNRFTESGDPNYKAFGVKGRKWNDSRIHHNSIENNFSIELPFENDRDVEIDHNDLRGAVSVPKFEGGVVLDDGYSFFIHHNYFTASYSIEGARNELIIDQNVFDFDIQEDGGTLFKNFGRASVAGPTTFTNNLIVNPGRGLFNSEGPHDHVVLSNNRVIANQTVTPRDGALINIRAADRDGNQTDYSTIEVRNNRIEVFGTERPLFASAEHHDADIAGNELVGVRDAGSFDNPTTGEPVGPQGLVSFAVGVAANRLIDPERIADEAIAGEKTVQSDRDRDGIPDNVDPAPRDRSNGLNHLLAPADEIAWDFETSTDTDPLHRRTKLSGITVDPDAVDAFYASDPYGVLTSREAIISEGHLEFSTSNGDHFGDNNGLVDGYGVMFNPSLNRSFEVSTRVRIPNGLPQKSAAAAGVQIGTGTQETFVKFTRAYLGGQNVLEVRWDQDDAIADAMPGNNAKTQRLTMSAAQAEAKAWDMTLQIRRETTSAGNTIVEVTPIAIALDASDQPIETAIVGRTFSVDGQIAEAIAGRNAFLPVRSEGSTSRGGLFAGVYATDFSNPANNVDSFPVRYDHLRARSLDNASDAVAVIDGQANIAYRLYLVDSVADQVITELSADTTISAEDWFGRRLSVVAFPASPGSAEGVATVRLAMNGYERETVGTAGSLFGMRNGNFVGGKRFSAGVYDLTMTLLDAPESTGDPVGRFTWTVRLV